MPLQLAASALADTQAGMPRIIGNTINKRAVLQRIQTAIGTKFELIRDYKTVDVAALTLQSCLRT